MTVAFTLSFKRHSWYWTISNRTALSVRATPDNGDIHGWIKLLYFLASFSMHQKVQCFFSKWCSASAESTGTRQKFLNEKLFRKQLLYVLVWWLSQSMWVVRGSRWGGEAEVSELFAARAPASGWPVMDESVLSCWLPAVTQGCLRSSCSVIDHFLSLLGNSLHEVKWHLYQLIATTMVERILQSVELWDWMAPTSHTEDKAPLEIGSLSKYLLYGDGSDGW